MDFISDSIPEYEPPEKELVEEEEDMSYGEDGVDYYDTDEGNDYE